MQIARTQDPALKEGEVHLAGQDLTNMLPFEAARAGVQLVPEDRRIIPGVTVEENLILAQIAEPKGREIEGIYEHFPRLAERRKQD